MPPDRKSLKMSDRNEKWCHDKYHPQDTNFDLPLAVAELRKTLYGYVENDFSVTITEADLITKKYCEDEAIYILQNARNISSSVQWANNIPLNSDINCFRMRETAWLSAVKSCAILTEENKNIGQYIAKGRNTQKYVDLNSAISNIEARIKGYIKSDRKRYYKEAAKVTKGKP